MVDDQSKIERRSLLAKEREPGKMYDIYKSEEGVLDLFADGYFGMWGDPAVSRIGLYISEQPELENEQTIEQRVLKARLVMPTRNLVQMCLTVVKRAAQEPDKLGVRELFHDAGLVLADAPTPPDRNADDE